MRKTFYNISRGGRGASAPLLTMAAGAHVSGYSGSKRGGDKFLGSVPHKCLHCGVFGVSTIENREYFLNFWRPIMA